jgi:hypothetical protein
MGVLLGLLGFAATSLPLDARAQEGCRSWGEARSAGWIEKFSLRPASGIKASVESRYKGTVINFLLCQEGGRIVYRMAVFQPSGKVVFVTEPAQ